MSDVESSASFAALSFGASVGTQDGVLKSDFIQSQIAMIYSFHFLVCVMDVQLEPDVPAAVVDELKSRGHRTIRSGRLSTEFGRGQFIFKLDDGYFAASEKRTDGQAVGF